MNYRVSTTGRYHREDLDGLGWELTICNSLWPADSPCRCVLKDSGAYGARVLRFLEEKLPMKKLVKVVEVGGGYGFLMKDFLELRNDLDVTMMDISPFLLERQKENLRGYDISYILGDFIDPETVMPDRTDLVIMNENLGDFPTVITLHRDDIGKKNTDDPILRTVRCLFDTYGLQPPDREFFNFNMGALQAVEKICTAGVPCAFLSEHSCESTPPEWQAPMAATCGTGNPEQIRLRGHDEYTIKFSHLENVAKHHGYRTQRGPMADYLPPVISREIGFLFSSAAARNDRDEIIRQFLEDLYLYEYLLIVRE